MASKAEMKFVTTLSFAEEIARALFNSYEGEVKGDLIRKRSLKLYNSANKHMKFFCPRVKINDKELVFIAKAVKKMMDDGLESTKSFQVHLSMLIGMLSEQETALVKNYASKRKIECVKELQSDAEKCWLYFSSRTRREDFDSLGFKLVSSFNKSFS